MKEKLKLMLALLLAVAGIAVYAAPGSIVYRGRLLDNNGNVVNSAGLSMKFLVYSDLAAGTLLYQDWHDGSDAGHPLVAVSDGLYKATVGGDVTDHGGATYTSLTDALTSDDSVYLEIIIGATTLTPREKLQSVPFAINAGSSSGSNATRELDNLQSVAINTSLLPAADNTIDLGSGAKTFKDAYVKGNITDGTNTTTVANIATLDGAQILTNKTINPASNSVTLADGKVLIGSGANVAAAQSISGDINISNTGVASIQSNSVVLGTDTTGDYVATVTAGNGLSGDGTGEGSTPTLSVNVDDSTVEINADALRVKDLGIDTAKLASNAVTTAKITDANVTNAKLANSSVTVTAGDGLKDGGAVALGASVTVNVDPGDGIQISADKVAVDATVVRTSGDQTVNGIKTYGSIPVLPGSNPTTDNQAARKAYVDNMVAGLSWKDAVRAATTADIVRSGEQAIDGVAVVTGDRVLVKNQTTGSENGIYIADTGAWTRATDMDASDEVKATAIFATDGTAQKGTAWVCNNTGTVVLDTTVITFAQFSGTGTYTAGNGLTLTGNEFAVGTAANGGITANADDIQVNVDASTIEINANTLRVKDAGITNAKISNNAVTLATQTTGNYVATVADAGSGAITVSGSGSENAAVTLDLANDAVTTAKILNNAVTNAKMADDSVNTAEIVDSAVNSAKIADGAIVNADINAAAAIVDTKLAQLTTANKVAGSAVQLNATGAIEDNTGLQLKLATGSGLTTDANGVRITVCNKLDANAPPTKNNDVNDVAAPNGIGYAVGSIWVDTTNKNQYVCVDSTDGASVWRLSSPLESQTCSGGTYVNRSLAGGWL